MLLRQKILSFQLGSPIALKSVSSNKMRKNEPMESTPRILSEERPKSAVARSLRGLLVSSLCNCLL